MYSSVGGTWCACVCVLLVSWASCGLSGAQPPSPVFPSRSQVRLLQEAQQGLRQLLFSGGAAAAAAAGGGGGGGAAAIGSDLLANVTGISSAAAPRAEALLGSAQAAAGRLAALLLGAEGDGLPGAGGEEEGEEEEEEEEMEAGRLAGGAGAGEGGRLAFDMEKEQLKDEVVGACVRVWVVLRCGRPGSRDLISGGVWAPRERP